MKKGNKSSNEISLLSDHVFDSIAEAHWAPCQMWGGGDKATRLSSSVNHSSQPCYGLHSIHSWSAGPVRRREQQHAV